MSESYYDTMVREAKRPLGFLDYAAKSPAVEWAYVASVLSLVGLMVWTKLFGAPDWTKSRSERRAELKRRRAGGR